MDKRTLTDLSSLLTTQATDAGMWGEGTGFTAEFGHTGLPSNPSYYVRITNAPAALVYVIVDWARDKRSHGFATASIHNGALHIS